MRATLKSARLAKGLSVSQIAHKIGVTPAIYYKWEAGQRDPMIENARQVALILGLSIEELFFEKQLDETSNNQPTGTCG